MTMIARFGIRSIAARLLPAAMIVFAAAGAARAAATPKHVIRSWPAPQRAAAGALIEKYGDPSQFDRQTLVWFNNGNWKRTVVYRHSPHHAKGAPDRQFLQQTIGYIVPDDKLAAVKKFNDRLEANETAGELTFSSDSEATNLLALNLADEIVVGKKSVAQAREVFAKTSRLAASGKSSPYTEGLRFPIDNNRYMAPSGADQ